MTSYTVYHAEIIHHYRKFIGTTSKITEVEYLTNDSGEGLFTIDRGALKQHAGNGQFNCSTMRQMLTYLNNGSDSDDYRYFSTRSGAERWAKQREKPLVARPVPTFSAGQRVFDMFDMAGDWIVLSQSGENLTVQSPEQPEYTTTVSAYDVYNQ